MLAKMYSTGIILLIAITLSAASKIEGLWQVNNSKEIIEIRTTNQGIKAKFVESHDWDHYDYLRNNTYEDRQGNRYTLQSSKNLTWESRDGRKKLRLFKAYDNYNSNRNYGSNNQGSTRYQRKDRYDDDYNYRQGRNDYGYDRYDQHGNDNYSRNRYDHYGNDNYGRNNRYDDGFCSDNCAANCSMHRNGRFNGTDRYLVRELSGTWSNKWKNTVAYVEFDGFAVQMKTNKNRNWTTFRRVHPKKLLFEDRYGNTIKFTNSGKMEWKRSDNRREIVFRRSYF